MKTKAIFHTASVSKNEFQEDIRDWSVSFTTGCSVSTVKFKDTFEDTQLRNGVQLYCTVRKNPNTTSVSRNDKVVIQGQEYRVIGVDPMVADFSKMMFLLDLPEGSV